jgi:hypothetical protein
MKLPKWLQRNPPPVKDIGHGQFGITTASECPACRANLDAATKFAGPAGGPKPGDLSCCYYCGALLEFGDDLQLKFIPDDVWSGLDLHTKHSLLAAQKISEDVHGKGVVKR